MIIKYYKNRVNSNILHDRWDIKRHHCEDAKTMILVPRQIHGGVNPSLVGKFKWEVLDIWRVLVNKSYNILNTDL